MAYDYGPYMVEQAPRRRLGPRARGALAFLALAALVAVGVTVYVMLSRLSDAVLTVIATVGCSASTALPTLIVAVVLLLRRAENGGRAVTPPTVTTPPQVMVIPPMTMPAQAQRPETVIERAAARRFTVVGAGDD
jgi:hypothetical protein